MLDEYEPLGIRFHSFVANGDFSEAAGYDTNADALPGGHASSVFDSKGSLSVVSDWTQHEVNLNLSVDDARYPQRTVQNQTDWTASLGGIYDLGRDKLGASYTHLDLVQRPNDLGAAVTTFPVPYQVDAVDLSYTAVTSSPLSFVPEVQATRYQFETPGGTPDQSQSYRNRLTVEETLTGRYELAPQRSLLLVLRGTEINYQQDLFGLPERNSTGGAALAGVDLGRSGPFQVRALVGYQIRDYHSKAYAAVQSPIVEGEVGWLPTRLTRVDLTVRRGIDDSASENVVGYTYTAARVAVRHEYQRNIFLGAYAQLENADYSSTPVVLRGTALSQDQLDQTVYSVGLDADYFLSRHLRLTATYDFSSQNAADTGNFAISEVLVALHLAL